jgi:hypothetical protein
MKTENLEALLLDRAFGQLGPEVAELLDEYLMQNPTVGVQAAVLRGTVEIARVAVALPPSTINQTPLRDFAAVQRSLEWRGLSRETLKIAACVAVGLSLGWMARASKGVPDAVRRTELVRIAPPPTISPAEAFWSRKRIEAELSHPTRRHAPLPWPIAQPQQTRDKS